MVDNTPEPGAGSIRSRNVSYEELRAAEETLISLKEDAPHEEKNEAMEIVAILRAAYREGEIEAGRRAAGYQVVTEQAPAELPLEEDK